MNPEVVTTILSALTVMGLGAAVFLASIYMAIKQSKHWQKVLKPVNNILLKYSFHLALIVSLTATLGSLYFSEIAGYEPCKLCWYQRILMYPQVLLLSVSILRREFFIKWHLMVLSSLGALIAAYHYYLQWGGNPLIPCSTVGYSVDCAKTFILEFGFVSIPFMALTAFLLITLLMLFSPGGSRFSSK